jgi:hypothetical protein
MDTMAWITLGGVFVALIGVIVGPFVAVRLAKQDRQDADANKILTQAVADDRALRDISDLKDKVKSLESTTLKLSDLSAVTGSVARLELQRIDSDKRINKHLYKIYKLVENIPVMDERINQNKVDMENLDSTVQGIDRRLRKVELHCYAQHGSGMGKRQLPIIEQDDSGIDLDKRNP